MENQLAQRDQFRLPAFVEDAFTTVDKMEQFANLLLKSKLAPHHFYAKGTDGKPDFEKGDTAKVIMVLLQGYQLGMPPQTALQQVVPVNGLLSIKGDGAKMLIFNSGKLKPGTWKEETTGTIKDENMVVTFTAERLDNGERLSRSFSVDQAKRAGLWVEEIKTKGNDGWKFLASGWWKYPDRMIKYRALGFIARDLFPDVLLGVYTEEEAKDMIPEEVVAITTAEGTKISIPAGNQNLVRSKELTESATEKIGQRKLTTGSPLEEAGNSSAPAGEIENKPAAETPAPGKEEQQQLNAAWEDLKQDELMGLINEDPEMIEATMTLPGKNTKKKLLGILYAQKDGTLRDKIKAASHEMAQEALKGKAGELPLGEQEQEQVEDLGQIPPAGNQYGIFVPDLSEEGSRSFDQTKALFDAMSTVNPPIDKNAYSRLSNPDFLQYGGKEDFCKRATVAEINTLLNSNK